MNKATLTRGPSSDEGTPGILVSENGVFKCATGELPWVDLDADGKRDKGVSRIKAGQYLAVFTCSPSRKNADDTPEWSYELQDVPDASGVRIHSGNFCGDRAKGYASDVEGCIILGADWVEIPIPPKKRAAQAVERTSQRGVSASRQTVATFQTFFERQTFMLTIVDAPLG